ncbi:MAG: biotin-dependent carboxyltransferase family protein [Magnetovibrionaceae bacterium]
MAALRVINPGLQSSIQDLGRPGFARFGIPKSGAADPVFLQLANALVGNDRGAPAIEFRFAGPTLETVDGPIRVGLAGDVIAHVTGSEQPDKRPCPPWTSFLLKPGERLSIIGLKTGATGYISVAGGLDLETTLGSSATYPRANLGGLGDGRLLQAGDTIPLKAKDPSGERDLVLRNPPPAFEDPLRAIPGPQDDHFDDQIVEAFFAQAFRVSREQDRMGIRLEASEPLVAKAGFGHDLVSDGLVSGSIQVPGSGQPIILGIDCQTIGGYPKIATVISADIHRLGQLLPGQEIRFQRVSRVEALKLRKEKEKGLQSLIGTISPYLGAGQVDLAALYSTSLVSGMVNAHQPDDPIDIKPT